MAPMQPVLAVIRAMHVKTASIASTAPKKAELAESVSAGRCSAAQQSPRSEDHHRPERLTTGILQLDLTRSSYGRSTLEV